MELFTSYGMGVALALLATLLLSGLWCRKQQTGYRAWILLCVTGIPLAWLSSRAAFCLANIPYFVEEVANPVLALNFWEGGASLMGALAGLIAAAAIVEKVQRLPGGTLLDAVGLGAPLGVIIARLAESVTGSMGLGSYILSDFLRPLAVTEDLLHPVYAYEAVAAAVILIAMLVWLGSMKWQLPHRGDVLLVFMVFFGCSQVVLDSLRDDRHMLVIHFVHVNQILAIILPVIALTIWTVRWCKKGAKKSLVITAWLVTAACIALGIVQEFAVDSSTNLFRDYGLMALAMAVMGLTALIVRAKAEA